eukprot:COSAG04_NODE_1278_length_7428_cov_25.792332_8_plen_142_part_00
MYLRAQPTEGGLRIQSYSHSLTTEFMGDWSPATPTGLNTSHDYQPDGLVVWPYEGIYIGIGNVFNTADTVAASGAVIGQVNMVSQRHCFSAVFARFAPFFRRFSAVILCCLASWRQDGENGRKMAENGRNLGEKRARNSGG